MTAVGWKAQNTKIQSFPTVYHCQKTETEEVSICELLDETSQRLWKLERGRGTPWNPLNSIYPFKTQKAIRGSI
jgi:hypothetical protein